MSTADLKTGDEDSVPAVPLDAVQLARIHLSFLIHDVSRMRRRAFGQLSRRINLTPAQSWVLVHLCRSDGLTQAETADLLEAGRASTGTTLRDLERKGVVTRRIDPQDSRVLRIYLTQSGVQAIEALGITEDAFNQRILADLGPAEVRAAVSALRKIRARLVPGQKPYPSRRE